jgi:hypothetical protein
MSRVRAIFSVLALGASVWVAAGCQSIAGIEDRTYEPAITGSPECEAYCDDVMQACTGTSAMYPDRDACISVCGKLPHGEVSLSNSIECRSAQAELAVTTGEPVTYCPAAGPYGAGTCGTTCKGYCSLLAQVCPDDLANIKDCEASCQALKNANGYDLASLATGDTECVNAAILPRDSSCQDLLTATLDCDDYCRVAMVACQGSQAVYDDLAQCKAVCAALDAGTVGDTNENTAGCRLYHAYNALADPAVHCSHAGPGGDGHCGQDSGASFGNCVSYCRLAKAACKSDFDTNFGDDATCLTECASVTGHQADSKYAVGTASGATLQCRLHQASLALAGDGTACAAVFGAAPCGT